MKMVTEENLKFIIDKILDGNARITETKRQLSTLSELVNKIAVSAEDAGTAFKTMS